MAAQTTRCGLTRLQGTSLFTRRCLLDAPVVAACLVLHAHPAVAISLSTIDSFAATSEGWQIGGAGVQPTQVGQPGPDGQTGYLSHLSDGGTANGKWLMWNGQARWLGDYPAAGVTGIGLAANVSSGTSPVSMRIAFDGPGGWFASAPQSVVAGWNSYSFSLSSGGFTHVAGSGGTGSFSDTMAGVTRFEVLAGEGGVAYRSGGDLVQAGTSTNTILLDDIAAVPEPTTLALAAVGAAAALARVVWRRRS